MERKDNHVNNGKILAKDVKNNNFKDYLVQEGFNQLELLESDFNSEYLTFNDIIGATESQLDEMLQDHNVKVIQRIRFIRAVKEIPNAKANPGNSMLILFILDILVFLNDRK